MFTVINGYKTAFSVMQFPNERDANKWFDAAVKNERKQGAFVAMYGPTGELQALAVDNDLQNGFEIVTRKMG